MSASEWLPTISLINWMVLWTWGGRICIPPSILESNAIADFQTLIKLTTNGRRRERRKSRERGVFKMFYFWETYRGALRFPNYGFWVSAPGFLVNWKNTLLSIPMWQILIGGWRNFLKSDYSFLEFGKDCEITWIICYRLRVHLWF